MKKPISEMENKFHGLPPLKRFRLMQQLEHKHEDADSMVSTCLPAKKRKESRDSAEKTVATVVAGAGDSAYCLPAKKRVWAFQPDHLPDLLASPFDLNVEYTPSVEEEKKAQSIENGKEEELIENGGEEEEESIENGEKVDRVAKEEEEEEDDGIVCAVCQSTDGDPIDPIVLCDGCDLMVHTTCYGNPLTKGIPEGDWFCNQCSSQAEKTAKSAISCCLCPSMGGAMKPTSDGRWAHVVCALYVPEVFFEDPEGRDRINCSKVAPRRWEGKCYVCDSEGGCVLECSELKCGLGFHVTCGLKEELCFEYKEGRKGTIVAGFCKDHTELWKKQQQTGKFKIVAREEDKNQ